MIIASYYKLVDFIAKNISSIDAIVVEGYDGVGKGKLLEDLSDLLSVTPYRPDYNLWQQYDHRQIDRWKISGFFWDVYTHFYKDRKITRLFPPLLFDRGVISGAVYNNDSTIADNYKSLLRDMRVLHILVTCTREDYLKFLRVRTTSDVDEEYECLRYQDYTQRYIEMLNRASVDYIIYENKFNEIVASSLEETCEGCGHYSYGWCRHPVCNCKVDKSQKRCSLSTDKEVQDQDVQSMHCL